MGMGVDLMAKGITMKTTGMTEVIKELESITESTDGVMKQCVYMGAGEVADVMRAKLGNVRTQTSEDNKNRKKARYPYAYEKQILQDNMGIAPITSKGTINTKVGFDGYYINKQGNKRPIPLLANTVNAGTSFMKKQDFVSATARSARNACLDAMQKQLNKAIERLTK
jgi:hypothetical protein